MSRLIRGASLSFVACALMFLTSFAVFGSAPTTLGQVLVGEQALSADCGAATSWLCAADVDPANKLDPRLVNGIRESKGPFMVYVVAVDVDLANRVLESLGEPLMAGASADGIPAVELMELDGEEIVALAASAGVASIIAYERPETDPMGVDAAGEDFEASATPSPEDYNIDVVHGAVDSWNSGFTGQGVLLADIDDGFDMAHPDMQGQQARYTSGKYTGWPIAYDDFAAYKWKRGVIGGWVADTSTEVSTLGKKSGVLLFEGQKYLIKGLEDISGKAVTSKSGIYHMGYHPDDNLEYMYGARVAVLVVDTKAAGVYDTVYVDVTHDFDFTNDKPCTKGDEISYFDFYDATTGVSDYSSWNAGDGYADISGGMVYWMSDGAQVYPASDWLYGATFVAGPGDAVALMGAFGLGSSHGTMTSSAALAQARTMGGLLGGMAPEAKLICLPFTGDIVNDWLFAEYGADGILGTGDEADICTNSYGWSSIAVDSGYNIMDHIAITISLSGKTMWFWSAGNGGPGYGTAHTPTDFSSVHVGAGTTMQCRYLQGFEKDPSYQKWGDVIPFSNSGPGRNGKLYAEIVASGAWSLEPAPLNMGTATNVMALTEPGNGAAHYQQGSGTSHATPTVAGGAALGFDAYFQTNGEFPTKDLTKATLMAAATDMHYDPFKQGTGWLDAYTLCKAFSGQQATISLADGEHYQTAALYPGDVYGDVCEAFPNFMRPGADDVELVTSHNTGTEDRALEISSQLLLKTGSASLATTTVGHTEQYIDVTDLVPEGTHLLRATMCIPIEQFDPDLDTVPNCEYWLDLMDWVDLNGNGNLDAQVKSSTVWELFMFTRDSEGSNYLEAMVKDPLERITDGLIVRIRPWVPLPNVEVNIKLDFYTLQPFPWAGVREMGSDDPFLPSMTLDLPAGESRSWEVGVSVPEGAIIGTYGAGIYIDDGDRVQCMPIVVNVPATSYEFEFGGESYFDTPYNNDVIGVGDKYWRFEVGDWRMYWCLPDQDAELLEEDAFVIAAVDWTELPTDVNVHMLAPIPVAPEDPYTQYISTYGPGYYETIAASSDERYLGAGVFDYYTNTGGPREVIAGPVGTLMNAVGSPAPFAVVTRCPIMSGHAFFDTPTGSTRVVNVHSLGAETQEVVIDLSDGDPLSGTLDAWLDMSVDGEIELAGGGGPVMQTFDYPSLEIYQDVVTDNIQIDLANAAFTQVLSLQNCAKLTVTIDEVSEAPDIDLGVWFDADADGVADSGEEYWSSATSAAYESLTLVDLADGQYLIKVHGYLVTGSPGYFTMTVKVGVGGTSVTAALPESALGSGFYAFDIEYMMPALPGDYLGIATIGFMGSKDLLGITILFRVVE